MNKINVPYSVVTEGALSYFKEDIPLWVIMLLCRIHHFNSRKSEPYALYLDKESMKLRVRPSDIIIVIEGLSTMGDINFVKANAGLYLITMSEELLKKIDSFS